MTDNVPAPALQRQAFDHLMARFDASAGELPTMRWPWLEAAHVLGQTTLGLHWRSHTAMLRYALQLRDGREVFGQLLRLALVPLGHMLQRLPLGNIGRAKVPALRPMEPGADITGRIQGAQQAAQRAVQAEPGISERPGDMQTGCLLTTEQPRKVHPCTCRTFRGANESDT